MASTKVPIELSSTPGIVDNSNATAITIDSSENVGIGTSSPSANLHVSGGNATIYVQDSNNTISQTGLVSSISGYDSASTKAWLFGRKFGSTALYIEQEESSSIIFNQGGSEIARFSGSGQLGIGTSSPSGILHLDMGTPDIVAELSANSPTFTYRNGTGSWFHAGKHPTNDYFYIGRGATTTTNVDMVVDNSGNVGIGITTPSGTGKLTINGEASVNGFDVGLAIITNAANTTSPYLKIGDEQGVAIRGVNTGTWGRKAMCFYTSNNTGTSAFNPVERMRIASDGDTTIGTTVATGSFYNGAGSTVGHGFNPVGYAAHVRGGTATPLYVSNSGTGSGTFIEFYQNTTIRGSISFNGTNTLYNATSDYRLKENVVELPNALERVGQLNPVQFDWIESGIRSEGFLAHEAQAVVPYSVTGQKDELYTEDNAAEEQLDLIGQPKYQNMDYGKLTPLLVKAIQEQQVLIEQLQAEVALLKGE